MGRRGGNWGMVAGAVTRVGRALFCARSRCARRAGTAGRVRDADRRHRRVRGVLLWRPDCRRGKWTARTTPGRDRRPPRTALARLQRTVGRDDMHLSREPGGTVVKTTSLEAAVKTALQSVMDPEIPVVSVLDMGMIREIDVDGDSARIVVLPTFVGCPAVGVIKE